MRAKTTKPAAHKSPRAPEFVNSLARGLAVIIAFSSGDDYLSISEISRRTNVPRAAVRRALMTLEVLGYLSKRNSLYHLRPKVLTLGNAYRVSNSLLSMAQPLLSKTTALTASPCSLVERDGNEALCIASSYQSEEFVTLNMEVGTHHPLYCTASGRLFLAHSRDEELRDYFAQVKLQKLTAHTVTDEETLRQILKKTRQQGFAIVDGEYPPSSCKIISVPVYNQAGELMCAVATAVLSQESAAALRKRVLPLLQECARDLTPIWLERY